MRKIIPVVAAGATALAVAGGTFGYAAAQKDVTLSVDGAATTLSTRSSTVGDILDQQGITLGEHDIVAPPAAASISDGTRIAVQYGRRVTVNVDGKPKSVWTTATDVNQALAALGVNTTGAAISTSRSSAIGRQGLAFDVATLKTVKLNAAGQRRVVKTTGRTVAQVLSVAKITVDGDDRLSAKPSSQVTDGSSINYTRIDVKTLTTKKSVPFDTVRKHTASLERGDTSVDHAGKSGKRTLTFVEVRHNGKVVRTEKTGDAVTTKPHSLVILVGTHLAVKKVPAQKIAVKQVVVEKAEPKKTEAKQTAVKKAVSKKVVPRSEVRSTHRSSSGSSSKSSSSARSSGRTPRVSSGGVWDKIAKCESGGNWSINTGNGFYGGLQFTKSTWRAYGGSGMPNHASRSTQIRVAKRVPASQGWGAWPGCTSKLGIR